MIGKTLRKLLAGLLAMCLIALPGLGEGVQNIATRLAALGFLSNSNADTAAAIQNFQIANGLEASGEMDAETASALSGGNSPTQKEYLQTLAASYVSQEMHIGSMGEAVSRMQRALGDLGFYSGAADGVFGDATALAVRRFQTANGLYPSGEADAGILYRLYEGEPVTWENFLARQSAKKGDSGQNVRTLQRRLRAIGYFQGECTATFGEQTQRAVQFFQREKQIAETGEADQETLIQLFSHAPDRADEDGILRMGDAGEDVRGLQLALHGLGFYTGAVSGSFDERTLTSVVLFEVASGLAPDGRADADLLERARAESAPKFSESVEAFEASLASIGEDALRRASLTASDMLGKAFAQEGDELFPGFAFVQYVYAAAGFAIYSPGQVMEKESRMLGEDARAQAGEIVALERASGAETGMRFGVCLEDGKIAYASSDTGYVVSQELEQMEFGSAYAWNFALHD